MRNVSNALKVMALLAFWMPALGVFADTDRVEHFKGKPAETLEQALENLHEGNQALDRLLNETPITAETSYEIHQLTYTLENALERMRGEMERLAEELESVHLASEANQGDRLDRHGQQYLNLARQLFGSGHGQHAP